MGIQYSKQAEKFLDKQNDKAFDRITIAVDKLPGGDILKMSGSKDLYRLRVGSVRVLFKITGDNILIEKIENRGQAYRH